MAALGFCAGSTPIRRETLRHRAALAIGGEIEVNLPAGLITGRCRRRVPTCNSRPIEPRLGSARSLGWSTFVPSLGQRRRHACKPVGSGVRVGSPPLSRLPQQCQLALREAKDRSLRARGANEQEEAGHAAATRAQDCRQKAGGKRKGSVAKDAAETVIQRPAARYRQRRERSGEKQQRWSQQGPAHPPSGNSLAQEQLCTGGGAG